MNRSIIFITKAPHHFETIQEVLEELGKDYPVFLGKSPEECLEIAREQVKLGTKIIISTAYLQRMFMQELNVIAVSVRRSGYSFVSILNQMLQHTDKVAIISRNEGYDYGLAAEEARVIWPEQVFTYYYSNEADAVEMLPKLKTAGFSDIICPSQLGSAAESIGLHSMYIPLPKKDIREAIEHSEYQLRVYEHQTKNALLIGKILNIISEGVLVLDCQGIVTECNDLACKVLRISRAELIGQTCDSGNLAKFGLRQHLASAEEVYGSIVEINGEMLIYDVHALLVDSKLSTMVVTFNRTSQIQEAEQRIRHSFSKTGNMATKTFASIVGGSPSLTRVMKQAKRYAQFDAAVLISAPSGCGKELFAQSIHNASPRANGPFVVINCAALPESVLESLLFGYESGAFTGASKDGRPGLFEQAHGGTVFLDEVSEMPLSIQSRFLRVLQEKEVSRIGSSKSIPVNIRVLSATNRNMWELIRSKAFREDLYHRISTLLLDIPGLDERPEDIPILAQYYVNNRAKELNLGAVRLEEAALNFLSQQKFSGNVRQLNNVLERALVLSDSKILTVEDIQGAIYPNRGIPSPACDPIPQMESISNLHEKQKLSERASIEKALRECGYNRTKTAGALGISTTTLWRKMKAFGISEQLGGDR